MRATKNSSEVMTGGWVLIHSAPRTMARHLDWALTRVMGEGKPNQWQPQPASAGELRTEFMWQGPHGSGAQLASELAGWATLRFEVTEQPVDGLEASRWMYTPSLGLKRVQIDAAGNTLISEQQLLLVREAVGADTKRVFGLIDSLLASDWDAELEPFRRFGLSSESRLNRVG